MRFPRSANIFVLPIFGVDPFCFASVVHMELCSPMVQLETILRLKKLAGEIPASLGLMHRKGMSSETVSTLYSYVLVVTARPSLYFVL